MAYALPYFWGLLLYLSPYLVKPLPTSESNKKDAKQAMLYSYKHSFSGFSAMLNSTQANNLANAKGVISVFKSRVVHLHTTRSWDFLGLSLEYNQGITWQQAYADDVIIGVFDTGIWPESASFREESGLGPLPRFWKGKCLQGENFDPDRACNRKLIGARYYLAGFEKQYGKLNKSSNPEYRSARDFLGHGTHTASTAVGSIVKKASFLGFGLGTARGGAPRARLAVYKVCWNNDLDDKCTEADILAAFDDALHDGVNIISASFGQSPPLFPFAKAAADIGSFHAMQNGVTVVFSAGNDGPEPSLVGNVGPWSICVAASAIDRAFPTQVVLDGKYAFMGQSFLANPIKARLAYARTYFFDEVCKLKNFNNRSAAGKVILCFSTKGSVRSEDAELAARKANASALIFIQPLTRQVADVNLLPVIHIDIIQGTQIYHHLIQSMRLPAVQIFPSTTIIKKSPAPVVDYFSSRGPSSISPDILKPDISAPGINILAAWPSKTPPTLRPADGRSVSWNFQSGTSMSCPHVSGVAALIKSAHPQWSPAAIRSALMTTAYTTDTTGDKILTGGSTKTADPFDIGAGHINPIQALDPGLVYDMKTRDYIIFLCNTGYIEDEIKSMVIFSPGTSTSCPQGEAAITNANINYPSITVSNLQSATTIRRTVRNVGHRKTAIYFGSILNPNGVDVEVWPRVLFFSLFKEEFTYYITLSPKKISQGRYDFGEIVWSDGLHYVRSPLVICVNTTEASDGTGSIART